MDLLILSLALFVIAATIIGIIKDERVRRRKLQNK